MTNTAICYNMQIYSQHGKSEKFGNVGQPVNCAKDIEIGKPIRKIDIWWNDSFVVGVRFSDDQGQVICGQEGDNGTKGHK